MAPSRRLRRAVRLQSGVSASRFLGVAAAWAGVACDCLSVMLLGLALCGPLLLGLDLGLGVFSLAAPVVASRHLWRLPGAVARQSRASRADA